MSGRRKNTSLPAFSHDNVRSARRSLRSPSKRKRRALYAQDSSEKDTVPAGKARRKNGSTGGASAHSRRHPTAHRANANASASSRVDARLLVPIAKDEEELDEHAGLSALIDALERRKSPLRPSLHGGRIPYPVMQAARLQMPFSSTLLQTVSSGGGPVPVTQLFGSHPRRTWAQEPAPSALAFIASGSGSGDVPYQSKLKLPASRTIQPPLQVSPHPESIVAKGKTFPLPLGVPAENDQYKLVPHSVAQLIHLLVERKRSSPVPVLKQSSTDMPAPRSVPARNRPSKPSANGSILEALQGGKAAKKTPKAKLVKLPAFSGRPVVQKLPVQEGPREYSRFTGALSFSFDARKSHTTTNVMSA